MKCACDSSSEPEIEVIHSIFGGVVETSSILDLNGSRGNASFESKTPSPSLSFIVFR